MDHIFKDGEETFNDALKITSPDVGDEQPAECDLYRILHSTLADNMDADRMGGRVIKNGIEVNLQRREYRESRRIYDETLFDSDKVMYIMVKRMER